MAVRPANPFTIFLFLLKVGVGIHVWTSDTPEAPPKIHWPLFLAILLSLPILIPNTPLSQPFLALPGPRNKTYERVTNRKLAGELGEEEGVRRGERPGEG